MGEVTLEVLTPGQVVPTGDLPGTAFAIVNDPQEATITGAAGAIIERVTVRASNVDFAKLTYNLAMAPLI